MDIGCKTYNEKIFKKYIISLTVGMHNGCKTYNIN